MNSFLFQYLLQQSSSSEALGWWMVLLVQYTRIIQTINLNLALVWIQQASAPPVVPPSGRLVVPPNLTYTPDPDLVTGAESMDAAGAIGIFVDTSGVIDTLAGKDTISGTATSSRGPAFGIYNTGQIQGGEGNDIFSASARLPNNIARVQSYVFTGIYNSGRIEGGAGNDTFTAIGIGPYEEGYGFFGSTSIGSGTGIDNSGSIDGGPGDDTFIAQGGDTGIINRVNSSIDGGEGNDTFSASRGIKNDGSLEGGQGNDTFITQNGSIANSGSMGGGEGDDTFSGSVPPGLFSSANFAITNTGRIDGGSGNDSFIGNISNRGTIEGGDGDDTFSNQFYDNNTGIENSGIIDAGTGNDSFSFSRGVTNRGTIDAGMGNDSFSCSALVNIGIILGGDGDDTITGSGSSVGIYNDGLIDTGNGNDLVNALTGGFAGNGYILLGTDNDTVEGFGTGHFDGGSGTDALLFGTGTYTVSGSADADGFYTISNGVASMLVKNFELIGSANNPANVFNFSSIIGGSPIVIT